jgi:hypothetical protein
VEVVHRPAVGHAVARRAARRGRGAVLVAAAHPVAAADRRAARPATHRIRITSTR